MQIPDRVKSIPILDTHARNSQNKTKQSELSILICRRIENTANVGFVLPPPPLLLIRRRRSSECQHLPCDFIYDIARTPRGVTSEFMHILTFAN